MDTGNLVVFHIDKMAMAEKGWAIYQRIKDALEPQHKGEIVAIEVDSGDYFLGRTTVEAGERARKKYPDKVFYFIRVGFRAVHKFTRGWL